MSNTTVGTVDIAVKLNTANFAQQVKDAVNYTSKAFNSIDISKAFQNQFKQTANVVQQASKSIASATQDGIINAMSGTSKSISKTAAQAKKEIGKLEKELEQVKKDYAKENAGWEKDLYNARTNFAGGANSPQYNAVLRDADEALRPLEKKIDDINNKIRQQKQLLAEAINQAKQLDAQKQLSSAVSSATQANSLVKSITSTEQYNTLLNETKNKMALIEKKASDVATKTGINKDILLANNSAYIQQSQILNTIVERTDEIKTNILQTKTENLSQLSTWDQIKTAVDSVRNVTSDTNQKISNVSVENLSKGLTTVGTKLSTMGGTAGKLGSTLVGVGGTLAKFGPYVAAAVVAIKALWNGAVKFKHAIEDAFEPIKNAASQITSKIGGAIQSITNQSSTFENTWSQSLGRLITLMGTLFSVTKMYGFFKESIKIAGDTESAWAGLITMADKTGNSFENAQSFIKEYTADGLVTITDAVTAYKTLISAKYTEQQTKDIMNAFKDTAAFGRQSGRTVSEAVKEASEGVKNQNSVLTDNAGITKNLSVMYREYAAEIGTTEGKLTEAQKRLAIYNGMLKEAKLSQGNAANAASTFNGKLSKLSATFYNLKVAVGNVFIPVLNQIIPILNNILLALTRFFNGVSNLLELIGLKMPNLTETLAGVTTGISDVGTEATDTANDIASTGSAAKKAANDIKRAFAGIDEINVLNFNKNSSSGSGSGGGGVGTGSLGSTGITETTNPLDGLSEDIDKALLQTLEEKARILADGINKALDSIDWNSIKAKAKVVATNIAVFLNAFIKELDWNIIGNTIAQGLNTALTFANTLLDTFNFYQLGSSIATGLSSMIHNLDWELLGQTIGNYFNSTIHYMDGFVTNFKWEELGLNLAKGLKSSIDTIDWDSLSHALYTGINGAFLALYRFITGNGTSFWSDLGKGTAEQLNKTIKGINFSVIGETLAKAWNAVWDYLHSAVENFDFEGLVDDIIAGLNRFIDGADWKKTGETVGNLLEKILKAGIKLLKDVKWKDAIDEFLDGVDLAQLIVDYYKLKNDLWWAKVEIIGELVMDAVWDGITGWFTNGMHDFGQFLWDHLVQPWIDTKESIKEDQGLLDVGGNIVKGILEGISGILFSPNALFKEFLFDPFVDAIEVAFGIASPAKKMEPIGEYIIEGIFEGIKNKESWLTTKWEEVKGWFTDVKAKATITYETTKEKVKTKWGEITSGWKDKKQKLQTAYETTKSKVSAKWKEITSSWKDKKSTLKTEVDKKKSWVSSQWTNITSAWKDKKATLTLSVQSVITNMKKWVNDNVIKNINRYVPFIDIPLLAQGGYVPANSPRLAIIGDNKREGEIVSPESKMEQVVQKVYDRNQGSNGKQEIELTIYHKYPDGRTLIQTINKQQIQDGKITLLT